jgi:DNA replication protein DnaC
MTKTEKIGFTWIGTGLPRRLHGLRLDALLADNAAPQALSAVSEWYDGLGAQQEIDDSFLPRFPDKYGQGLLLTGLPGTGKTVAAAAAACEVRRVTRKSVFFTRWAEHVQIARDLVGRFSSDASDPLETQHALHAVNRVVNAFLVILDDVGQERITDTGFGTELLESTLRRRYDEGKPTIVTSNLTSQQWVNRYTAALRSFMAQACRIVVFDGPDLRSR